MEPVADDAVPPDGGLLAILFLLHTEVLYPLNTSWERESIGPAWTRCLSPTPQASSTTEVLGAGLSVS